MRSRVFETSGGPATLRSLTVADQPALVAMGQSCACLGVAWRSEHYDSQLRTFAEGQVGVEAGGQLVGSSASHIVIGGQGGYRRHTRAGITEDGYFHNHDPRGDTLYVSQINVIPAWQRRGIGTQLLKQQIELCHRLNLRRLLVPTPIGARSSGSTQEQPEAGSAAEVTEPVSAFLVGCGLRPKANLQAYATLDAGLVTASLFEWINPDYVAVSAELGSVRVALVQHQMRGVDDFDEFASRIEYFARAARGYNADFVLFPEFTSLQLLSSVALRNRPPDAAIATLAQLTDEVFGLFSRLAQDHRLHIIGGSHPVAFSTDGNITLQNICPIALPDGRVLMQPKLHITPSETEAWGLRGGAHLAVIPTPKARIGVLICYDSEFPEAARHLADQGVDILFVPYCTDDRQGHLRVLRCCQARAIENQIYVAAAGLIGNLPGVAGLDIHYGRSAVFTPSDFGFARDGVQAQADPNVETLLVTDLDLSNLHRAREHGSVRPRLDRRSDLFQLETHFASSGLLEYRFEEPPASLGVSD